MGATFCRRLSVVPACLLLVSWLIHASPVLIGVSPEDERYFGGAVISCKDGSKSFPKHRLNDGFCDCADGTDEPGTSACPESKFYCRNVGDTPQVLFSSRVNDRICDCCDGSDEYDGGMVCSNTCLKGGNSLSNKSNGLHSKRVNFNRINAQERRSRVDLEDLIQNIKGLRVAVVIELVTAICLMTFCLFSRRIRGRRRHYLWRN